MASRAAKDEIYKRLGKYPSMTKSPKKKKVVKRKKKK